MTEQVNKKVGKTTKKEESTEVVATKNDLISLAIVHFDWGERVTALYVNKEMYFYGDHYHAKPLMFIDGFKQALEFSGITYTLDEYTCIHSDISENITNYGGIPPKNLNSVI